MRPASNNRLDKSRSNEFDNSFKRLFGFGRPTKYMAKSFVLFISLRFYYGRNQYFLDIAEVEAFEIDNKNVPPGPFDMCTVFL